jgi:hypothetical protein
MSAAPWQRLLHQTSAIATSYSCPPATSHGNPWLPADAYQCRSTAHSIEFTEGFSARYMVPALSCEFKHFEVSCIYTWVMFCRLCQKLRLLLFKTIISLTALWTARHHDETGIYVEYSYCKTLHKVFINVDCLSDQSFGCSSKLLQHRHELIILFKLANIWSLSFGSVSASWSDDCQRAHSQVERAHI